MAFRGMTIGPEPQVIDLAASQQWTIQNVSEDHSAVLRVSIQPSGVTPPEDAWGAVAWLRDATISRDESERFWMRCEGGDSCEIVYERAS